MSASDIFRFASIADGGHPCVEYLSLWKGRVVQTIHHRPRTMTQIIDDVAHQHKLMPEQLVGPELRREIAHPRQMAIWLCRQEVKWDGSPCWSYPQIGRRFNRDHTTAIHACRQYERRRR